MTGARSSKKQQELLQFIDSFIREHKYGPSYREIMHGLGYKSVSTVAIHVNGLLAKGYIRKKDHSARSIEIVSMQQGKQAAVGIAKSEDYLQGFDRAVRERLASDSYSPKDHEVLVRAAEILGSTQTATFRAQLVGRHGDILEADEEGTADSTTT